MILLRDLVIYIYICMNKKYTLTVLGVCMRDIFVVRGKGCFFV